MHEHRKHDFWNGTLDELDGHHLALLHVATKPCLARATLTQQFSDLRTHISMRMALFQRSAAAHTVKPAALKLAHLILVAEPEVRWGIKRRHKLSLIVIRWGCACT